MTGFAGMNEERGRSRGCQSCSDFRSDMTGFAHAGDNDAAGRFLHYVERFAKAVVKLIFHHAQSFDFLINGSFGGLDILGIRSHGFSFKFKVLLRRKG